MERLGRLGPALIAWAILAGARASAPESSDAYLRNVVSELQLLNGVAEAEPTPAPSPAPPAYRFTDRRPASRDQGQLQRLADQVQAQQQIHEVRVPPREDVASRGKLVLGLSAAELAAMYRQALERGAPLRYNALVDAVQHHAPRITGPASPYDLLDYRPPPPYRPPEDQSSPYAYYFYPLQSFRHELENNYGYRTVPDFKYDSPPAESSKKETSTMNPILVGISSFLGMALFFMVSLFFYPRFMHLMHLPFVTTTRTVFQNELAQLAMLVTDAIAHYDRNLRKKSKRSIPVTVQKRFQIIKRGSQCKL